MRLTQEQKPPLRLLLGSDAYSGAEKNDLARLEEARSGRNSAYPRILSLSPQTASDPSEPSFVGIRPTDVPPFRAAQIVRARLALFVSVVHVKDRLKRGDGVSRAVLETVAKSLKFLVSTW